MRVLPEDDLVLHLALSPSHPLTLQERDDTTMLGCLAGGSELIYLPPPAAQVSFSPACRYSCPLIAVPHASHLTETINPTESSSGASSYSFTPCSAGWALKRRIDLMNTPPASSLTCTFKYLLSPQENLNENNNDHKNRKQE